jgi:hypothetical protein
MQPNDEITLTAFLSALSKLNQPLPADVQTQLNEIGKALAADPTNLGNLDIIAESYEPLDTVYQQERTALQQEAERNTKGLPPLPLPKEQTKELINTAIDTYSSNDSVAAIQKQTKQNILKNIWKSIRGSN